MGKSMSLGGTGDTMDQAPSQPASPSPAGINPADIEAFAQNAAPLVEEGGKALAAYLKPREEGKIKSEVSDDVADVIKTLGQVAEYWMADPQRTVELQSRLGRAYLDLWASAVRRMAGEETAPIAAP